MSANQLELELVNALEDCEFASLVSDYAEVGIDVLLDDGILKDIPVLGTFKKTYDFTANIQNRIFAMKLLQFLINFKDVPKEQRQKQISRPAVNAEERTRVGENLILLLDRMNHMSKPTMMGQAFRAYLLEEIDRASLHQL